MDPIELAHFRLPHPWAAIDDDHDALALGHMLHKDVAGTVQEELQREICEEHPLFGIKCRPVAWDSKTGEDFLFTTNLPESPFVLVHFTWIEETNPAFPFIVEFKCFDDFIRNEREHHG
jgi:hypothetical protein